MKRKPPISPTHRWGITLGFVAIMLSAWELASYSATKPEYLIGPVEIANEVLRSLSEGGVWAPMLHSLYRTYMGFFLGGTIGVILGLLSGVSRPVRDLFDIPQAFLHAIPKISLFPAVAVWLGFTDASRILIISLSCFFPAYLNATSGALGINPRYLWLSRNNEVSRIATFLQVIIPASLPRTMVGLRISLMVAFILMVATEVIGNSDGLGTMAMTAYQDGDYGHMYAAICLIAIAGYLSNLAIEKIAEKMCHGQMLALRG